MSKGSVRRPEDAEAVRRNWPLGDPRPRVELPTLKDGVLYLPNTTAEQLPAQVAEFCGIPIVADPDVPPGEVQIRGDDGDRVYIRGLGWRRGSDPITDADLRVINGW